MILAGIIEFSLKSLHLIENKVFLYPSLVSNYAFNSLVILGPYPKSQNLIPSLDENKTRKKFL
ncbi:MAG: hypothetical protein DRG25_02615 [Deltaproteobacteria bacterium]|nr:MAG: hypothetical protein DRG25_02615 [Deltaproteobacteria bacterium]